MRAPLLAPCQEDEVCTKGRSRCRLRHKGGSTRNQAVISLIYIFSSHLLPPPLHSTLLFLPCSRLSAWEQSSFSVPPYPPLPAGRICLPRGCGPLR